MDDIYLTGEALDGKRLLIAPITSRKAAKCPEPPADTSGYFLMEEHVDNPNGALTILARVADTEAAFRLGRLFSMT